MNEQIFISSILEAGLITVHQAGVIRRFARAKNNIPTSTLLEKKETVKNAVLKFYNQTWGNVISKSRLHPVVTARHIYFYCCLEYLSCGVEQIAKEVGARDHTTSIHAREKIKDLISIGDEETLEALAYVKKELHKLKTSS